MAFLHEGAPCGMRSLRSDTLTMRVTGVRITVFSSAIVTDVIVHCRTAGALLSQTAEKQLSLSSCGWVLIRSGQFMITETLCRLTQCARTRSSLIGRFLSCLYGRKSARIEPRATSAR